MRMCRQNLGHTIFDGPGLHFCAKFGHNSRIVGRTGSATSPSCFSSNFTSENFGTSKFTKMHLLRAFLAIFWYEITTILTPRLQKGVSGRGGGGHLFRFESP